MPYGLDQPDWGGHYNTGQFYPLYDMAELAARLGSMLTYDRRGALIWWDDFRYGVDSWEINEFGDAAVCTLAADHWEKPPFSARLIVGDTLMGWVTMARQLEVPQTTIVGFQVSAFWGSASGWLEMYWWHRDGGIQYETGLLVDPFTEKVYLYTDEGNTLLLSDIGNLHYATYFAHFKIVYDMEDHVPVRAIILGEEYDLSGYACKTTTIDTPDSMSLRLWHNLVPTGTRSLYLDNVIVTAAEPAN